MTSERPTPRTRPEAAALTRRLLLDAAVAQLAEHGMRGLTHRRVEQRAGVAQGQARYHFGTLDGMIEAVLQHMVDLEIGEVISVDPEVQERALKSGEVPLDLLAQMEGIMARAFARKEIIRARFELYLYAVERPELQQIVRRARNEFVSRAAATLPGPNPEAAGRMVVAMIDGLLLDQISAPEEIVERYAGMFVLATGAAGMQLPADDPRDGR